MSHRLKSWRPSKWHHWLKSHGHFTEYDFACWWNYISQRSARSLRSRLVFTKTHILKWGGFLVMFSKNKNKIIIMCVVRSACVLVWAHFQIWFFFGKGGRDGDWPIIIFMIWGKGRQAISDIFWHGGGGCLNHPIVGWCHKWTVSLLNAPSRSYSLTFLLGILFQVHRI